MDDAGFPPECTRCREKLDGSNVVGHFPCRRDPPPRTPLARTPAEVAASASAARRVTRAHPAAPDNAADADDDAPDAGLLQRFTSSLRSSLAGGVESMVEGAMSKFAEATSYTRPQKAARAEAKRAQPATSRTTPGSARRASTRAAPSPSRRVSFADTDGGDGVVVDELLDGAATGAAGRSLLRSVGRAKSPVVTAPRRLIRFLDPPGAASPASTVRMVAAMERLLGAALTAPADGPPFTADAWDRIYGATSAFWAGSVRVPAYADGEDMASRPPTAAEWDIVRDHLENTLATISACSGAAAAPAPAAAGHARAFRDVDLGAPPEDQDGPAGLYLVAKKQEAQGVIWIGSFTAPILFALTSRCPVNAHVVLWLCRCLDGRFLGDKDAVSSWLETYNWDEFTDASQTALQASISTAALPNILLFSHRYSSTAPVRQATLHEAFTSLTTIWAHFYGPNHQLARDFAYMTRNHVLSDKYDRILDTASSTTAGDTSDAAVTGAVARHFNDAYSSWYRDAKRTIAEELAGTSPLTFEDGRFDPRVPYVSVSITSFLDHYARCPVIIPTRGTPIPLVAPSASPAASVAASSSAPSGQGGKKGGGYRQKRGGAARAPASTGAARVPPNNPPAAAKAATPPSGASRYDLLVGAAFPPAIAALRTRSVSAKVAKEEDPANGQVYYNGKLVCLHFLYSARCMYGDSCSHAHITADASGNIALAAAAAAPSAQ